jgi:hypothetical protein
MKSHQPTRLSKNVRPAPLWCSRQTELTLTPLNSKIPTDTEPTITFIRDMTTKSHSAKCARPACAVLFYCTNYTCSHSVAVLPIADRMMSGCPASSPSASAQHAQARGDVRPDFHWNKQRHAGDGLTAVCRCLFLRGSRAGRSESSHRRSQHIPHAPKGWNRRSVGSLAAVTSEARPFR